MNPSTTLEPFSTRLRQLAGLSQTDIDRLEALALGVRLRERAAPVVHMNDRPERMRVLLAGWAYRFQLSKDGRRNIGPVLLPGDVCDLDGLELDRIDHSVATFTNCRIAEFPRRELAQLCQDNAAIGRAFRMMAMLENALITEWLVNVLRRPAWERVGHFFCELQLRLRNAGESVDEGFDFPLTQMELADVLGLSPVHVNRTLQMLRTEGLIELRGQRLSSPDWRRLRTTVGFNARYLHLNQQGMTERQVAELQLPQAS